MQIWVTLLVKGLLIGLLASIPLGPIGVICVQRTVNKGRLSGFISGLGAASADTIFATIAGFSLTFIITFIEEKQIAFQIAGGLVVVALGAKIFFTNPIRQLRRHKRKKNSLTEEFISVLLLTITNPLAVFFFLALFAAFGVVSGQTTWYLSLVTLGGVFLGAGLWWYTLTSLVNIFRNKFRLKQLWWINKISGIAIFILGIFALAGVFVLL